MSSNLSPENSESFSITRWIGGFVLVVIIIVMIIVYEYDRRKNYPSRPLQIITLQGTLAPLSPENFVTYVTVEKIPEYRIINPIDSYKEIYIFSNAENKEFGGLVAYAEDKISCSGEVKLTGREVEVEVVSGVKGGTEGETRGGTQMLIDMWECVK